jgi:hypothetical protein
MYRPTVLILASDPAFVREITAHWPRDTHSDAPEFTVLGSGLSRDLKRSHYDLAIADASSAGARSLGAATENENNSLRESLAAAGRPAIVVHSRPSLDLCHLHGAVIELRREPGIWPAMAALVGREILLRRQAESRAREAERLSSAAHADATLGRYMIEMRTNVNNALTTVLGNAELLLFEPGLPASVLAEADAIRHMALRLHEIFQRFASIEKELTVADREPGKKAASATASE